MKKSNVSAQMLAVCGALIALTFVSNNFLFKIKMPYGGSATLFSMLFLYLCGYFFGPKVGILAGVAYGFLDLSVNPSIVHPAQLILDYPLAFGLIGAGSLLRDKKNGLILGYLLGVSGRFIASTLSGIVFFASYTPEGMSTVIYSLSYNAGYIYGEAAITIVVMCMPVISKAIGRLRASLNQK